MTKREIKREVNLIYNELIIHSRLSPDYKIGMERFKYGIVNFISEKLSETKKATK